MLSHTLYLSLRSPFARRIRLLLEELGVRYEIEVIDVFAPPAWLAQLNPMNRVPVLRLPQGEVIVDSTEIHAYFKQRHLHHSLFDARGVSEARLRKITGLSLGVMEYCVGFFLECTRPPGLMMPERLLEFEQGISKSLEWLHEQVNGPFLIGDRLSVWDLDLGAALAYSDLRIGPAMVDRFPGLRAYLNGLNAQPSFQKTIPPS